LLFLPSVTQTIHGYPDAASHLDDHIERLLVRLDEPAADPEGGELVAQIDAREAATRADLPLRALALRAGLHRPALDVLLIAAAPTLDQRLADRVRVRTAGKLPTIEEIVLLLAPARVDEPAVRAALAADAPLLAHGLVELAEPHVRVDERVIAYLRGETAVDRRLHGIAALHASAPRASAAAVAAIAAAIGSGAPIVVEGPRRAGKTTAAVAAITAAGGRALVVDLELLVDGDPRGAGLARARREAMLQGARLVLRAPAWDEAWSLPLRRALLDAIGAGAILTIESGDAPCRALVGPRRVRVAMPTAAEQAEIWRTMTPLRAARPLRAPASASWAAIGVYDPAADGATPGFVQRSSAHAALSAAMERELAALFAAGPRPGETIEGAYLRLEHQLGTVFARLSAAESRGLHQRLSAPRSDDWIAAQFARLSTEPRHRLLAFLADARRREATGARTDRIAS
jgi:hypothetical protein